jgi:Domain of unknown function (DUF4976)
VTSFAALIERKGPHVAQRPYVVIEHYSDDRPMPWVLDADYRAIRTHRHKFIHWVQHPEFDELYDLLTDTREERNTINESRSKTLVSQLRIDLGKLVRESISL